MISIRDRKFTQQKVMSSDPVQKYLMRTKGKLTALQSADLTILAEESDTANKLFAELESAAHSGDVYAATIYAAVIRSKKPEYGAKLLADFEVAAQTGDPFAMQVCAAARSEKLTSADAQRAFEFAKYAAQSEFPPGLAELGYCYEDGRGTPKNLTLALAYLNQAARLEYSMAACHLAAQFASGQPYGSDPDKAIEYATMAFNFGEAYGAYLLGSWYEEGTVAAKNETLARHWYDKAARQGSGLGCIRMAAAFTNGELGLSPDSKKASEYHRLVDHINGP
jgi:uncharacterized protein